MPTEPNRGLCYRVACMLCATAMLAGTARAAGPHTAGPYAAPTSGQPAATADASLPEPIYWRQNLFLVPYQWSSAADPGAARAVWLFVSKDGGHTWQKISEAEPHVKAFTYHAEADGEYAFAIRTVDASGRQWPAGPYQPELRVIVDTTMPRIESLRGTVDGEGVLDIHGRATDPNLDPNSWTIEVQTEPGEAWHAVMPTGASRADLTLPAAGNVEADEIRTRWKTPDGERPVAIRATVFDLAGNSATYHATVGAADRTWDAGDRSGGPLRAPPRASNAPDATGWISGSAAAGAAGSAHGATSADRPAAQPWPAGAVARGPFRLPDVRGGLASDGVTAYGRPEGVGTPAGAGDEEASTSETDRYAMVDPTMVPPFKPLEPFRTASSSRTAAGEGASPPPWLGDAPLSDSSTTRLNLDRLPAGVEPRWVGSRTFALEYELEDPGHRGVSRVELWGTRNGGQTWRRFADDPQRRGSLRVTVDDAGLYGFCIVVEAAGGPPPTTPQPGDQPELWVAVDLDRPRAELLSVQPGDGNQADHLLLRWRAEDDHLDARPISLFYSSRPGGPWSTIATGLANTGTYAWRVERHVPSRFYLRLEVRDLAGNVGAYQTAEPIDFEPPPPAAVIHSVEPMRPTSTAAQAAYR